MPTESEAVTLLEELGLTEYEARCFVALARVSKAAATEISDLSGVPRSRVYDAVDRLHERGLVDVQQSNPREYQSIPPTEALDTLREQYQSTVEDAASAFEMLDRAPTQEQSGAWAIADHDHVSDRIATLVADATDEVYLLVVDADLIDSQVVDQLAAATDQDVDVIAEVPSPAVQGAFEDATPDATVRRTPLAGSSSEVDGQWLGRILMADRSAVLISSVTVSDRLGRSEETAIWASGANHGLVVGLRHLLGTRIDDPANPDESA